MTKKASNVKKNQSGPWLIDQVTPECPKPQSNHPRVRSQNIAHPRGGKYFQDFPFSDKRHVARDHGGAGLRAADHTSGCCLDW